VVTGRKSKAVAPSKRGRKKAGKSVKKAKTTTTTREPGETQEWNYYDWATHYAALLDYRANVGNCNLKQRAIYDCVLPGLGEGGSDLHFVSKLGLWLNDQRKFKRAETLSPEREALLQQLADEGMY